MLFQFASEKGNGKSPPPIGRKDYSDDEDKGKK